MANQRLSVTVKRLVIIVQKVMTMRTPRPARSRATRYSVAWMMAGLGLHRAAAAAAASSGQEHAPPGSTARHGPNPPRFLPSRGVLLAEYHSMEQTA